MTEKRICRVCGREFWAHQWAQWVCARESCRKALRQEQNRNWREKEKERAGRVMCKACGKLYYPIPGSGMRGCSPECDRKLRGASETKICRLCGIRFSGHGEYCSQNCKTADADGSARRPFTEAKGRKLGTADLIRKWHEEGWPAEKIANVLMRDVKQVKEVLDNA